VWLQYRQAALNHMNMLRAKASLPAYEMDEEVSAMQFMFSQINNL